MMFCQMGRAQSLREIEQGLASATAHRPWQPYQLVFNRLYQRCIADAPGHKFRFRSPLLSLDATTIDLCAEVLDWVRFRRTKGAVATFDGGVLSL
jgi:hypothetical protein